MINLTEEVSSIPIHPCDISESPEDFDYPRMVEENYRKFMNMDIEEITNYIQDKGYEDLHSIIGLWRKADYDAGMQVLALKKKKKLEGPFNVYVSDHFFDGKGTKIGIGS